MRWGGSLYGCFAQLSARATGMIGVDFRGSELSIDAVLLVLLLLAALTIASAREALEQRRGELLCCSACLLACTAGLRFVELF